MGSDLAYDLEELIRKGELWDRDALGAFVARLDDASAGGDPISRLVAIPLVRLLDATAGDDHWAAPVAPRLAHDIEAIAYPRIWKIIEALRAGMPVGELRNRAAVLDTGIVGLLAARLAEGPT